MIDQRKNVLTFNLIIFMVSSLKKKSISLGNEKIVDVVTGNPISESDFW